MCAELQCEPKATFLSAFAHSQNPFLRSEQEEGSWEEEQLSHAGVWLLLRLKFSDMEAAEELEQGMR